MCESQSPVECEISNLEASEPQKSQDKCELSNVVNCSDPSRGHKLDETFVVNHGLINLETGDSEIDTFHLESTSSSFLEHVDSYAKVEGFESTSTSFLEFVNSCAVEPGEGAVNENIVEFNSTTSSFLKNVEAFTKEDLVSQMVERVVNSHCERKIHNVNELIDWAEVMCESGYSEKMVQKV